MGRTLLFLLLVVLLSPIWIPSRTISILGVIVYYIGYVFRKIGVALDNMGVILLLPASRTFIWVCEKMGYFKK